jgi:hypothetical protein
VYACGVAGAIIGGLTCKLIFYSILIERFRPLVREYFAVQPVSGSHNGVHPGRV